MATANAANDLSVTETADVEIDGPGMNVKVKCNVPCSAQIDEKRGQMSVSLEIGTKRRRTEGDASGSSLPPAISQAFQLERIQREHREKEIARQLKELRDQVDSLADRFQSEDSDGSR